MPVPVPSGQPPLVGPFPNGETVQLLTAGTVTDPYSQQPSLDWGASTSQAVTNCAVEPRPSDEPVQDARNAVTSGYTLYLPIIDVDPAQRFMVRGEVFEVLGEPAVWRNPFTGWAPGMVVQVQRTEG